MARSGSRAPQLSASIHPPGDDNAPPPAGFDGWPNEEGGGRARRALPRLRVADGGVADRTAPVTSRPSSTPGLVFPNDGRSKRSPVRGASREDLEFYKSGCQRTLADSTKSKWHEKERGLLAAIEAELGGGNGGNGGAGEAERRTKAPVLRASEGNPAERSAKKFRRNHACLYILVSEWVPLSLTHLGNPAIVTAY